MSQWQIKEQYFYEPTCKLAFHFRALEDGTHALDIYGSILPFGNRTIVFGTDGLLGGGGTHIGQWPGEELPND